MLNNLLTKALYTCCIAFFLFVIPKFQLLANEGPTLLKKSDKKEKLREEDLVTKKLDINNLVISKYISLNLVKSIFPEATKFGKLDKNTLSIPIYKDDKEIGFLFETFDVTRGLGYSRRPFNLAVGVDFDGVLRGVKLLKHVEPIAILGRTDQDFIKYLDQYKDIDLKAGISLTLELTGSDIEGANVAMRETAGETDSLTQIDGVSRTTTSSLLFMDAIMRGSRKIARQKNIILDNNDLGNYLDLEAYKPQTWNSLILDNSITFDKITVGDLQKSFSAKKFDIPRSLRFNNEEELLANFYIANVSPAGIGTNILGRRWFDQYISAGRNVEDQVYYLAFEGNNWLELEKRISNIIDKKNLILKQDDISIIITKDLFKELPFNHAKQGPNILGQGLLYLNSSYKINPQKKIKLIYKINNKNNDSISFKLSYILPDKYKLQNYEDLKNYKQNYSYSSIWQKSLVDIVLLLLTITVAVIILSFNNRITKNRNRYLFIRIVFLFWVLVWLGWIKGGQLSLIHLINLFNLVINFELDLTTFLIEPLIFTIGVFTLISLFLWGRALFCGWLCPFGALQELIALLSKKIGIKQINFSENLDSKLRYIKYILLFLIIGCSILEFKYINYLYNIEPFKTAITLRFIAPYKVMIWALILLATNLYIERAYCRYLCPLGGGLAVLGKVRIINFLKRKKECGNPCKACNKECPTGAILYTGEINMNECLGCLDCQVMYNDYTKCPPLVALRK